MRVNFNLMFQPGSTVVGDVETNARRLGSMVLINVRETLDFLSPDKRCRGIENQRRLSLITILLTLDVYLQCFSHLCANVIQHDTGWHVALAGCQFTS